jgi:hypothetical protein
VFLSHTPFDVVSFRHALAIETEQSLARDPERWHHAKMADPDEHRSMVRRQPWRGKS